MNKDEFRAILAYHMARTKTNQSRLSKALKRNQATISNRMKEPKTFTVEELVKTCDFLGIPEDQRGRFLCLRD